MNFCQHCGAQLPQIENLRFCPNCGATLPPSASEPGSGQTAPLQPEPVPFDVIEQHGFFRALWLTWKDVMFKPTGFFTRVRARPEVGWAILFAIVVGTASAIVQTVEQLLMRPLFQNYQKMLEQMFPAMRSQDTEQWTRMFDSTGWRMAQLGAMPFLIVIGLIVMSAIFHAGLAIFGGAKNGFNQTVRALAFAHAAYALNVLPCCGVVITIFWFTVLSIIGLARVHETENWRAACAVLLPVLLLCMCGCALTLLVPLMVRPYPGMGGSP